MSNDVIIRCAMEGNGVFKDTCRIFISQNNIITLYDGYTIYPLCYNKLFTTTNTDNIAIRSILGKEYYVNKLSELYKNGLNNFYILHKVYSELSYQYNTKIQLNLPNGYSFNHAINADELNAFSKFKANLESEEIGHNISQKYSINMDSIKSRRPVFLKIRGEIIGVVCSNLWSTDISMVNTLYVDKKYRNKGIGTMLLSYYISFLFKTAKRVCLFYSENNLPAHKIYRNLGFIQKDKWILIVYPELVVKTLYRP
jgi:GNAT superfamily N-acetyltransferase